MSSCSSAGWSNPAPATPPQWSHSIVPYFHGLEFIGETSNIMDGMMAKPPPNVWSVCPKICNNHPLSPKPPQYILLLLCSSHTCPVTPAVLLIIALEFCLEQITKRTFRLSHHLLDLIPTFPLWSQCPYLPKCILHIYPPWLSFILQKKTIRAKCSWEAILLLEVSDILIQESSKQLAGSSINHSGYREIRVGDICVWSERTGCAHYKELEAIKGTGWSLFTCWRQIWKTSTPATHILFSMICLIPPTINASLEQLAFWVETRGSPNKNFGNYLFAPTATSLASHPAHCCPIIYKIIFSTRNLWQGNQHLANNIRFGLLLILSFSHRFPFPPQNKYILIPNMNQT